MDIGVGLSHVHTTHFVGDPHWPGRGMPRLTISRLSAHSTAWCTRTMIR